MINYSYSYNLEFVKNSNDKLHIIDLPTVVTTCALSLRLEHITLSARSKKPVNNQLNISNPIPSTAPQAWTSNACLVDLSFHLSHTNSLTVGQSSLMAGTTQDVKHLHADTVSDEMGKGCVQDDFKRLVEKGYDQIALRYLEWSTHSFGRMKYLQKLLKYLPEQAEVLELGCGAGVPCTQILAQHALVTANDISAAQIALAKQHVPEARLIQADMMSLRFPCNTFDAVVAFYSIIHLPRADQEVLIKRLSEWLRQGGYLLMNLGTKDDPGSVDRNWLGSQMYWSSYDAKTNYEMIHRAGLKPLETEIICNDEDGKLVPFFWILAKNENVALETVAAPHSPVRRIV